MKMERTPRLMVALYRNSRCGVNYRPTCPLDPKHNERGEMLSKVGVRDAMHISIPV